MNTHISRKSKTKNVTFFIGDIHTEEVELHTPHKRIFVYTNTNANTKTNKSTYNQRLLKYNKYRDDFTNIFTWFVYEMCTFF